MENDNRVEWAASALSSIAANDEYQSKSRGRQYGMRMAAARAEVVDNRREEQLNEATEVTHMKPTV